MFTGEVVSALGYYVYRLIDPRTGETFYVGKGTGNRVFQHAAGAAVDDDGEAVDLKTQKIREIINGGFEVTHVIHRHGLDESTAYEVEAALIDAYPGVTNAVGGHGSDEHGLMHSKQIIEKYAAPVADFRHPVLIININRTATERDSVYESVRYAWKINVTRAREAQYVLAVERGIIIDAFVVDEWLPATAENFPSRGDVPGRSGFVGGLAPEEIRSQYRRHRIPDELRPRGAANPIRYVSKVLSAD